MKHLMSVSDLVQIFPGEQCLVLLLVEVDGEGLGLGAFLPQRAGAVPRQGVVPHLVVVGVPTRQDAAPAGAAQRRDSELHRRRRRFVTTDAFKHSNFESMNSLRSQTLLLRLLPKLSFSSWESAEHKPQNQCGSRRRPAQTSGEERSLHGAGYDRNQHQGSAVCCVLTQIYRNQVTTVHGNVSWMPEQPDFPE